MSLKAAPSFIGTGSPDTKAEILRRVGTYGRQLGKITDAMIVLLRLLPKSATLSKEESEAIEAFKDMANDIDKIKESHELKALRPRKSGAAPS